MSIITLAPELPGALQVKMEVKVHGDAQTCEKSAVEFYAAHMGQFLQDGENCCFMSFFFLKVEPPCDQT